MSLPPDLRRRVEDFVRPLYAGVDGEQTFARVVRLEARVARLRGGEPVDETALELLVLFHGAAARLGSLGRHGRIALFLRGLGLQDELSERVRAGLARLREAPESFEERLLCDALLLERAGIRAVAESLLEAGRSRRSLQRVLSALDPGPPAERYRTEAGAALGEERRAAAEAWIEALRRELRREEAG